MNGEPSKLVAVAGFSSIRLSIQPPIPEATHYELEIIKNGVPEEPTWIVDWIDGEIFTAPGDYQYRVTPIKESGEYMVRLESEIVHFEKLLTRLNQEQAI